MQRFHAIPLLLCFLALVGCHAFHIAEPVGHRFKQLRVVSFDSYDRFTRRLKDQLRAQKVQLTQNAPITLHILSHTITQHEKNALSMPSKWFVLRDHVRFQLRDRSQRPLDSVKVLSTQRAFAADHQQPLASEQEIAMIRRHMERDVILRIMHYLRHEN